MSVSTWTVFLILWEGPGYSGEYRSVRKSELISVDFPRPDSPARQRTGTEWLVWLGGNRRMLYWVYNRLLQAKLTQSADVYHLHFCCSLLQPDILHMFQIHTGNDPSLPPHLSFFLNKQLITLGEEKTDRMEGLSVSKLFFCSHFSNLVGESQGEGGVSRTETIPQSASCLKYIRGQSMIGCIIFWSSCGGDKHSDT